MQICTNINKPDMAVNQYMNCIKQLRQSSGITQKELAVLLKVKQSAISNWETGKTLPRSDKLPKLAQIFNCDINELFNIEGDGAGSTKSLIGT